MFTLPSKSGILLTKMFKRTIEGHLTQWKAKKNRKPLIIRGARQVGKTSIVEQFGKTQFRNMVALNLEKQQDAAIFDEIQPSQTLLQTIEILKNDAITPGETLLFIDEIQSSPKAMTQLRYFYEECPELHVIAAGSLLEVILEQEGFSFPVGRVEFAYLHPVTFEEFLLAIGDNALQQFLETYTLDKPIPDPIHQRLLEKYMTYLSVGGMPELVQTYLTERSLLALTPLFESLNTSFFDDVYKYSSQAKSKYIQHILAAIPYYCGLEVTYEGFGDSRYKSREMSEAFDVLEKAMLLTRIKATHALKSPLHFNEKKKPKLIGLDTGLIMSRLHTSDTLLNTSTLNSLYRGRLAEQAVGRALLSLSTISQTKLAYWYRDKKGASAQLDYLLSHQNALIPIEVKSGASGTLKSLFQFLQDADQRIGVRIYTGTVQIQDEKTSSGHEIRLLSLPIYLTHQLPKLFALL